MTKFSAFSIFLALCVLNSVYGDRQFEVPDFGTVKGSFDKTAFTKRSFVSTNPIQYAKADRFKAPVPLDAIDEDHQEWYLLRNCLGKKHVEYMTDNYYYMDIDETLSEECLYLTVHTRNETGKAPVMVHITGFDLEDSGTEEAAPNYLMEKDIVLVSVQYRSGPFGFLSTLTDDIPGNVGVLDVITALKWIQKHISHFGGDENKVTLFGQYRAASLINLLTISPLAKGQGLFHQVIYQSGTILMKDEYTKDPLEWARGIAKELNCQSESDVTVINECLKSAKAFQLMTAHMKFGEAHKAFEIKFAVGGPSGVLPKSPKELLEESNFEAVPTMGGVVKQPASYFYQAYFDFDDLTPIMSTFTELTADMSTSEHQKENFKKNFPEYIFEKSFMKAFFPGLIDYMSFDIKSSTCDTFKTVAAKKNTYLYSFNYMGEHNRFPETETMDFESVSMGDDNIYLFPFPDTVSKLNRKDRSIAKTMVDLWTSFATNGVPSAPGLPVWPKMEQNTCGPYMKIDQVSEVGFDYHDEYYSTLLDTTNYTPVVE